MSLLSLKGEAISEAVVEQAVAVAASLQRRAVELLRPEERRQQAELDRMLADPKGKATVVELTDRAFRSAQAAKTAEQFIHVLDVQGIPRFFDPVDRVLLRGFRTFGGWLPEVSVPLVKEHLQHETANVILPAETELLRRHLGKRQAQGVRMNVNLLGEAVVGEGEARRRLEACLEALQLPEVSVLSVKISTIYSQLSTLARARSLEVLGERLERLYRAAHHLRFVDASGAAVPKFIYLDMEEYRDLHLTAEAFMRTLSRPGLEEVSAGLALQAYLPDSARAQERITEWARQRVSAGGSPVVIRLVKGANLEMERLEAALRGWPQAPYREKLSADANYKRMLLYALRQENRRAVRIGLASHNLFDVALAMVLAEREGAEDAIRYEMLEGMANHQRRALTERDKPLLLYAPACRREDFLNAIGYLVRRLDENSGPENFLRHAFRLRPGSAEWDRLEAAFRDSCRRVYSVGLSPRRIQDRSREERLGILELEKSGMTLETFRNEPDTDFALPQNVAWGEALVRRPAGPVPAIPLVIDGSEISGEGRRCAENRDPSQPERVAARFFEATPEDIERAVACAREDPDGWRQRPPEDRDAHLARAAAEIRRARGALLRAALEEGGKVLTESDPEVSEAVDMVEYYRLAARYWRQYPGLRADGKGVVVVVPPWNFPIAIPCGGVAAALAAGNTVILKPASATVLTAWRLCECFWRAGISRRVLQFTPGPGGTTGMRLVTHRDVDAVILTGGTATALGMLEARPGMPLCAETGGKNAIIVTAMADRELAIKHVVHSAFSHGGQKCSAASLLLLEAEVYDDPRFREALRDAAASLPVGPAWDLSTKMGPLIRPPAGALLEALLTLEPGESWLLMPERLGPNPHLWSPGIKYGVRPGSVTHLTEFFGPLLGVMRYQSLAEAIEWVNQTGYGLTSGLQSLDEREHDEWKRGVQAGNLYINRGTTGAMVLRQPFGGFGKSAIGPGIKAGGPNYVAQFMRFRSAAPGNAWAAGRARPARPELQALVESLPDAPQRERLAAVLANYEGAWEDEFSREHDPLRLPGQDNIRRYLTWPEIRVRWSPGDDEVELLARMGAARLTGARVIVSAAPGIPPSEMERLDRWTEPWAGAAEILRETDEQLAEAVASGEATRIRFAGPDVVPPALRRAAAEAGHWLADAPWSDVGRLELLWYVREQSVSYDYHRYGNLGARAGEPRAAVE